MNATKKNKAVLYLAIGLLLAGCTQGPAAKAVTADDLSTAGLALTELPSGFAPLEAGELQEMQELISIVTADFPAAQVVAFTAYGKTFDSGQFDAIVISFYFLPLSEQDIALFDDPDLAGQTFSHGAGYVEQITGYGSAGESSAALSLSMQSFNVDELVARRGSVGFAALVLSGDGTVRLDLAASAAQALDRHLQTLLGE